MGMVNPKPIKKIFFKHSISVITFQSMYNQCNSRPNFLIRILILRMKLFWFIFKYFEDLHIEYLSMVKIKEIIGY